MVRKARHHLTLDIRTDFPLCRTNWSMKEATGKNPSFIPTHGDAAKRRRYHAQQCNLKREKHSLPKFSR
jgi:hypothetical protein